MPVQIEAAHYGVYTFAYFLLMVILRPTSEATRETFSYFEAVPTESEDQEIVPVSDRCLRRRQAPTNRSTDQV